VPAFGGIVVGLERMNRILEIDEQNLIAVVEPGVVTKDLDARLKPLGLFFAGYPMSEEVCQIGGNVAENAGGGRAVKYGVTGTYVLGLELVSPTGHLLSFGGKRLKDVTGYNLISLITGSEGTLGIITRVTLRLLPRPAARIAILARLPDESLIEALVPKLLRHPTIRPSAVEFADSTCMSLVEELTAETDTDEGGAGGGPGLLLVELDGADQVRLNDEKDVIVEMLDAVGATGIRTASNDDELERLWKVRKQVPWALKRKSPHQTMEDISVPVSATWALVAATRRLTRETGIRVANFGHLGDGNIHCTPLKPDAMDAREWHDALESLLPRLYKIAAELGGTISGEHGIGHKRQPYLDLVLGEAELAAFRAVKKALDPNGIMNPGKAI
jgi:glycolate oxidase